MMKMKCSTSSSVCLQLKLIVIKLPLIVT